MHYFISKTLVGFIARKPWHSVIVFCSVLIGGYYVISTTSISSTVQSETTLSEVLLITARDSQAQTSFNSVGTVQALSEAGLKTEASGQVTSVNTEIGKTVTAGSVLATIENRTESAQLLQAQGAYEAALAGATSGTVSVDGARNTLLSSQSSAITTLQGAYITIESVLHNDIDDFFSIRDGVAYGLKISGSGKAIQLIADRTAFEIDLEEWYTQNSQATTENVYSQVVYAQTIVSDLAVFVETLSNAEQERSISTDFKQEEKDAEIATIQTVRIAINGVAQGLESSRTHMVGLQKALAQAELSGANGTLSVASAQVKIALGSLRSAQANYEKTLVRTPISGVVNALYIKTGDYVNQGTDAILISNNKGLQIETAVNQNDRNLLFIGDSVAINDIYTGTITAIAGAVDPKSGKIAVKVSLNDDAQLENGTVAKITFKATNSVNITVIKEIKIPLEAIKLTASKAIVFAVDAESKLISIPIELGAVTGESMIIKSGLSADQKIVKDARGHKVGEQVRVITK